MAHDEPLHKSLIRDTTAYFAYLLLVTTLGPFQFGFHLAELNAPQDVVTCKKRTLQPSALATSLPHCIPMNTPQFSVVTSIFTLGGLIGALSAGPSCNKYGRLLTMRATTISFILGSAIETFAIDIPMLCFGRLISGLGCGAAIVVVPIYIAETAPPKEKGLFGAFTQISICLGILVTQLLGYFLSKGNLWRIILAVAGVIGLLQLVGLTLVPESPKWLAEHRSPQHARHILQKIRGHKADVDAEVKAWNIDATQDDISEEEALLTAPPGSHPAPNPKAATQSMSIWDAFIHPEYRPAIIAVVAVMSTQQLTGINSIVMYSVSLLTSLLPTTASLLIVAVSALNVVVTAICAPLSDKIGRKTCILLSIAGMGICSVLLALGLLFGIKILAAVATLVFVASFAFGLGPVPFILANELVGPEAVGATQSAGLAANWIATLLVSQFFPIVDKALGGQGKVYFIFAGFAALLGSFIAYWVPETKGKSGMEEVWGKRVARERIE
ncbi:Bifunctional purine biosynthesis protein PurH [Xanthoria parietina]